MGKFRGQEKSSQKFAHGEGTEINDSSYKEKGCFNSHSERWTMLAAFVIVSSVYLKSVNPSLSGGDSGELTVVAYEFGVAHPPGYPLFTILSKVFITIFPFGNVAWRLNLMSAAFGCLSIFVLYQLIFKLTKEKGPAILGAGFFAFNRLTWIWSISAEVFSLNNLLLSLLMLTSVELSTCSIEKKQKVCLLGAFLCGLCLSNQHTSALYLIFLIPWALLHLLQNKLICFRTLIQITCPFLLGLSPYLYLPMSSFMHKARWTWGDQKSFYGFMKHLLRKEYGTWDLLKDHTGQGFIEGLRAYSLHVLKDLSWVVAVLFILCPIAIIIRRKAKTASVVLTFFLMLLSYVSFFAWRANLDMKNPLFFKVIERFWIQSDLLIAVFAALSYSVFMNVLCKKVGMNRSYLDLTLVIPLIVVQASGSWKECNQANNTIIHDFALQTLHSFPNNSIILTKGDLCSNSYRYFHFCENIRPDLHIFDQEVLTYDWSLPMMREFYPGISFPGDFLYLNSGFTSDGRKAFTFKDLIDANIGSHPIFACIGVQEYEPSWAMEYTLWPYGVCWQLVKKDSMMDINKWATELSLITKSWSYNWTEEPNDGSWEYVANSEMWRAKTVAALFLLEKAIALPEGEDLSKQLLLKSYELYTIAMEAASNYPAYWHRNFAITCERLTRENTSLNQLDLIKKTVFHFKEFVRLEPQDVDVPSIKKAVKTLSGYLDKMEPNER